jgi:L-lactate dehydrogenase complex protein LldG
MSSKSAILASINAQPIPPVALPPDVTRPIRYEDSLRQFSEVLQMIGGHAVHVASLADAQKLITEQEVIQTAQQIVTVVTGIEVESAKRIDQAAIADPHDLERVDVAILRGEFAVAENGAIWCTDELLQHRVVYFLSQHVILLVPAKTIVHNMHEAYERLRFGQPGFGMFLAGPSKTADIEQSLVIGAHGARSLTVYLVEEFE